MQSQPIDYRYRPLYRPAHFAGLPVGWKYVEAPACEPLIGSRLGIPVSNHTFGIIAYNRELTGEEKERFQLEAV